ncbi:aldehyde dehydrogenase family protein [Saccharopolyspora sp. TS4A08]|uniref:Aldehyde dehydrogenase family protein n=1 Tax=Saccharopolyspora ipomoeae TaxID=3042027 RepID=A0ABT6PTQ7_9PSEU|nr:aldehyde dehydrogenase family protein [Saccharopolyspora sp. TS4A08]MDI2031389.1 aldehyde dehydrogenase family protein [Saccharopolyspora sp. TS4A08]
MGDNGRGGLITTEGVVGRDQVAWDSALLANRLRGRGVRPGDRVVLSAANSAEFVVALFALIAVDASIVLVDHRQSAKEHRRVIDHARARWLLRDRTVPAEDLGAEVISLENALSEVRLARPVDAFADVHDALSFDAWYERADGLVLWSSGTTGAPKGIVRSGSSVRANIERTQDRMRYVADDVLMPLLPFSHQYGLSIILLWWWSEFTLVVNSSHRLDQALDRISEHGVTVVDATPSSYDTMLSIYGRRNRYHGSLASVRMWCVGGAPLSAALSGRFRTVIGKPLLDGYGSSEAGNIALAVEPDPRGVGRALDGIDIRIVDAHGDPLPPGERGEVVVRTPDYLNAYLGEDGEPVPVTDREYRTHDLGWLDDQGNLTLIGRKRAVHRLGHTIYPDALVEKVERCGNPVRVVPFDHERLGSELVFVVADEQDRSPAHWRARFAAELAEYERPNRVVVVPEFPLNLNGKVDTEALREMARGRTRATPSIPHPERLQALRAVVEFLQSQRAQVHELLTEVSHHATVNGEIDLCIRTLEGAQEEVLKHRPRPVEGAAVFMPSNIPLYSYVLYLLIPSLYCDHVSFRASSKIADVTRKLHEMLSPAHKLPIHDCSMAQREFIAGPVAESELVVFTGTYHNAEKVRGQLSSEQLFVFFGQGVNPFVLGPDADLRSAIPALIDVRMINSGQDCFGPDRIFVHDSLADVFVPALCHYVAKLRHGDNRDTTSDYGSMYYLEAFADSFDYLRKHSQHIVSGGEVSIIDMHLRPTVLDLPLDPKEKATEMFAPIFNVVRYSDEQELLSVLNSPFYIDRAMGATVYGDLPEVVSFLRKRHQVTVNSTLVDHDDGNEPFGGRGIVANYAAVGTKRVAEPLLLSKAVADHLGTGTRRRELIGAADV